MTRRLSLIPAALLLSGCVALSEHHAASEARIAFDITEGNPKALFVKLATIDLTRKQLIESGTAPKIVCTAPDPRCT